MARDVLEKFKVGHLSTVVLIQNVAACPDAENDADRTVQEMVLSLDKHKGFVSKSLLESALYCCNLNNEESRFAHPLGRSFDQFLYDVLSNDYKFDKFYNLILENEEYGKKTRP